MGLHPDVDYVDYLYTCNRCRTCTVDKSAEIRPICPAFEHFGFFTYSGGGKAYVCQGILEGKVGVSRETLSVAMNCLLCGACASMCPPGFDTLSFIRDLRDYLVKEGQYLNDAHELLLEKGRSGTVWEGNFVPGNIPVFDGSQEILLYLGDRERSSAEFVNAVKTIFDAAGVSWGTLENELQSGAILLDLGDKKGFKAQAEKHIEYLNEFQADRIVILCPHDAATMMNDYFNVGDLEADVLTLTSYIEELIEDERLQFTKKDPLKVTYHDPCKLSRFLEEEDPPRTILNEIEGVNLVEMERRKEGSWCCGSGAWAGLIVPELSFATARKRIEELKKTKAETIVTACAYCKEFLGKVTGEPYQVKHIVEVIADRL